MEKVSSLKYSESTSNTISVGAEATTKSSVTIGLSCSLKLVVLGVRVVSIEETSVGEGYGVVIGGTNFSFASRGTGTVGSFRDFRLIDSTLVGTRATLFRFGLYSAIARGLPRFIEIASFGLFVDVTGSTNALVFNTFVLFLIN